MAMPSSTATITAPTAPSGFRRQNRPTSTSHPALARRDRTRPTVATFSTTDILVPDPGVEQRVDAVEREVDDDDERHDHQVDPLDDGVVALVDGVEEEPSHPGQPEDLFEDDRAAEDLGDLQPEDRHDGDDGVLERVLHHH